MIKTTKAALVALLMAGAPAFAQTMQPTTQAAQDQTPPITPEQTTPDQTAPTATQDKTPGMETTKPAHVKRARHLRHRHKTKAVTQAKANAGDTAKPDTAAAANPDDAKTDSTGRK